jgi:hypothetical protein
MNWVKFKEWARAPEPKGRYILYFVVVLFALLLIGGTLWGGAGPLIRILGNVACVLATHGMVKWFMTRDR